jgi:arginine deiminase
MTSKSIQASIESEVGKLEAVILHRPGIEVENMDPENAEKALYSDILNLTVAREEYDEFAAVLSKYTETLEVQTLLEESLDAAADREEMLRYVVGDQQKPGLDIGALVDTPPRVLASALIEGLLIERNTLTNFLSDETFSLGPLHNFLFVRDAAMVLNRSVLIGKMASRVREREARIMDVVFRHHPRFRTQTVDPRAADSKDRRNITIEGGDVIVARKDVLVIGAGARTTPQGIDFIAAEMARNSNTPIEHILVQELPAAPESFIHLDMVFTFLGPHHVMVYEPVILKSTKLRPIHIALSNGTVVSIEEEENLLKSLSALKMDLEPILCGGSLERTQKREQWHSGANFFALEPNKVVGYRRNEHTIEALSNAGFDVVNAKDVVTGKVDIADYERCVITITGAELARGGGGCRCLTLPVKRAAVDI